MRNMKRNIFSRKNLVLLLVVLLANMTAYIRGNEKSVKPIGIKVIGESTFDGENPLDFTHRISFSPDGKKLVFNGWAGVYLIDAGNIKKREIVLKKEERSALVFKGWAPDNTNIIMHDFSINGPSDEQQDFIIINTSSKEIEKHSVTKKSKSYSEKQWFVVKQSGKEKVTIENPETIKKDDLILKEGMIPYQINKKWASEPSINEENELWIKAKDKDIKIIDKVRIVYETVLSLQKNRLFVYFEESETAKVKKSVYDLGTNLLYDLPEDGYDYTWSPDGKWLLYIKKIKDAKEKGFSTADGHNFWASDLFITSWDGRETIRLTDDEGEIIERFVSWSPNNKIAFIFCRKDNDKIEEDRNVTCGIKISEIIFEEKK